jgi:hypothetical protein
METIKVKITRCSNGYCWYSNKIGETFDAEKSLYLATHYRIVATFDYVAASDCIVLKPCFKSDGTAETGKRIIAELERLGGKNINKQDGVNINLPYYYNTDGNYICFSSYIPGGYYLVELPEIEKTFTENIVEFFNDNNVDGKKIIIVDLKFPETGRPEITEPETEKELTPLQELENLLHKITAGVKRDRDENILRLKTIQRMLKAVTTPDLTHKEKNLLCDVYCKQIEAEIKQEEFNY